jgi:hypothetical protein
VIIVDDLGLMAGRLLNPAVIVTLVAAGISYGWVLWELDLRLAFRLWAAATFPGILFLIVIGVIRLAQGSTSVLYPVLAVDWLIFAQAGVLTVLLRRRWHGRRNR